MADSGTIKFSNDEAKRFIEEIKTAANNVNQLFDETSAAIPKLKAAFQSSTNIGSADAVCNLYESDKAHFEEFLNEIRLNADKVENALETYAESEAKSAAAAEDAFSVNGVR